MFEGTPEMMYNTIVKTFGASPWGPLVGSSEEQQQTGFVGVRAPMYICAHVRRQASVVPMVLARCSS